jgi:hypothetical protein
MAKAAFNKKRTLFTSTLDFELRKKLVKCYVWSIALYGAETWTLRAVDQKHLESFEMWCRRKANWIGHILHRKCLLQRVIEGEVQGGIEVTGRQGRRRRKLLDDLKERRGYSHLKEDALDRTMWRACLGRSFGPVVRQTAK